jgi:phosphotransferase system enzyme I (PtsI)
MCGEMAGYPLATVLLLGLGLDIFSMSAFTIPEEKKIIRSVSLSEAEEFVGIVMEMKSAREINEYVRKWMNERFDLISN